MLLNVFKNVVRGLNQKIFVVRGFSLVHDPEGSHYENVETKGDKRSMVDVGKNLNYDCQVLLYRCGEARSAKAIYSGIRN